MTSTYRSGGRNRQLRPRATAALGVVALSLFLILCLLNYGHVGAAEAVDPAWHLSFAGLFVEVFGAGAYALVTLPLVWGVVVYFNERTPALKMRAVGTVLLAISVAMITGLIEGPETSTWAGALGAFAVWLSGAFAVVLGNALAQAVVWTSTVALFVVSLVWATDWMFHSLRKGAHAGGLSIDRVPTTIAEEPSTASELRDPDEVANEQREFVRETTAAATAADRIPSQSQSEAPVVSSDMPEGFRTEQSDDRVIVHAPSGYQGVEFLPPSSELAAPSTPETRVVLDIEDSTASEWVDDDVDLLFDNMDEEAPADPTPVAWAEPTETAAPAPEAPVATAEEAVAEAAEDARPRSGIGYPDESPFIDDVITVDVVQDEQAEAAISAAAPPAESPQAASDAATPAESWPAHPEGADRPDAMALEQGGIAGRIGAHVILDDILVPSSDLPPAIEARSAAPPAPTYADEVADAEPETVFDDYSTGFDGPAAAAEPTLFDVTPAAEPSNPMLDQLEAAGLDAEFTTAVAAVLDHGRASAIVLQRRLGVGHARALSILEQMEQVGVAGAEDAEGARPLLMTREDWTAVVAARSA